MPLSQYFSKNQVKKYSVVLGVSLGCRSVRLPPLDPAEEGQDQGRVVGGDTGPSVPHTSHIFDA